MSQVGQARPKRSLGQNFLVDPNVAGKIVRSLDIQAGDTVLEIGPGRGALSGFLMSSPAGLVLAVEKDLALALALKQRFPAMGLFAGDGLNMPWERLGDQPGLRVVGNLPYNVASPILWDFASRTAGFAKAVFMVQNEVADRLVAKPHTKQYGALTAWLGNFVHTEKLFKVGPSVFRPQPRVDSAVVAIKPLACGERPGDPRALAAFLKMLFSKRRKQLGTIIGPDLGEEARKYLKSVGLSPAARPEDLAPAQLGNLLEYLPKN